MFYIQHPATRGKTIPQGSKKKKIVTPIRNPLDFPERCAIIDVNQSNSTFTLLYFHSTTVQPQYNLNSTGTTMSIELPRDEKIHNLGWDTDPPPSVIDDGPFKMLRIDRGVPFPLHVKDSIPKDHPVLRQPYGYRYVVVSDNMKRPVRYLEEGESYQIGANLRTSVGIYGPLYNMNLVSGADPLARKSNKNLPPNQRLYRIWRAPDEVEVSRRGPRKQVLTPTIASAARDNPDYLESLMEKAREFLEDPQGDIRRFFSNLPMGTPVKGPREPHRCLDQIGQLLGMTFTKEFTKNAEGRVTAIHYTRVK